MNDRIEVQRPRWHTRLKPVQQGQRRVPEVRPQAFITSAQRCDRSGAAPLQEGRGIRDASQHVSCIWDLDGSSTVDSHPGMPSTPTVIDSGVSSRFFLPGKKTNVRCVERVNRSFPCKDHNLEGVGGTELLSSTSHIIALPPRACSVRYIQYYYAGTVASAPRLFQLNARR